MESTSIVCGICGSTSCRTQSGILHHAKRVHGLHKKEYIDRFLIKLGGYGYCKLCNKRASWHEHYNYWQFCSKRCARLYNHQYTDASKKQRKTREATCVEKFGCISPFHSKVIQKKCSDTMLRKYGVLNPSSVPEICARRVESFLRAKPYKLPSGKLIYRLGYEPQFLDYVFSQGLLTEEEVVYSPDPIIYSGCGMQRNYYPDFYIPKFNLIVEVKSDYVRDKLDTYYEEKKKAATDAGFNFICVVNNKFDEFVNIIKRARP